MRFWCRCSGSPGQWCIVMSNSQAVQPSNPWLGQIERWYFDATGSFPNWNSRDLQMSKNNATRKTAFPVFGFVCVYVGDDVSWASNDVLIILMCPLVRTHDKKVSPSHSYTRLFLSNLLVVDLANSKILLTILVSVSSWLTSGVKLWLVDNLCQVRVVVLPSMYLSCIHVFLVRSRALSDVQVSALHR